MPAETERVAERTGEVDMAARAGDIIEITFGILFAQADRRVDELVLQRENSRCRLQSSTRSEQVSRHRFRRRNEEFIGMLAENFFDRLRFHDVVERR